MAQRPVQMAFPSGDIMRRSVTPRIETNFGGRGLQVTPASTITVTVLPDPSFADAPILITCLATAVSPLFY